MGGQSYNENWNACYFLGTIEVVDIPVQAGGHSGGYVVNFQKGKFNIKNEYSSTGANWMKLGGVFDFLEKRLKNFTEFHPLKEKRRRFQASITVEPPPPSFPKKYKWIISELKVLFMRPPWISTGKTKLLYSLHYHLFRMTGCRHVWYGCIGYCFSFNL